jgi:hypothetical protein
LNIPLTNTSGPFFDLSLEAASFLDFSYFSLSDSLLLSFLYLYLVSYFLLESFFEVDLVSGTFKSYLDDAFYVLMPNLALVPAPITSLGFISLKSILFSSSATNINMKCIYSHCLLCTDTSFYLFCYSYLKIFTLKFNKIIITLIN